MKKWADAHGLTMKEKVGEYILGANGTAVRIVGMTSMTLLLAPTLEIDVANVTICLSDFYQGLLRCDLLCGHNEALGATTITLPGPDQPGVVSCLQKKVGCFAVTQMEPQ